MQTKTGDITSLYLLFFPSFLPLSSPLSLNVFRLSVRPVGVCFADGNGWVFFIEWTISS